MVGVLNLLGDRYKARFPGPLAAYNRVEDLGEVGVLTSSPKIFLA